MNAKRFIAIALILILAFPLAACGGGSTPPSGSATNPPATTPDATPSGNDDPCPCCSNCIQDGCECAECADSDDCECKFPGGLAPSMTYNVKIEVELMCRECGFDSCGIITNGSARVTMDFIDSRTGYCGSAKGSGETIKNGLHEIVVRNAIAPGDLPSYEFTARLSISGDSKTALVGVDSFGSDESTYDWSAWGGRPNTSPSVLYSFIYLDIMEHPVPSDAGIAYPDPGTGFVIFEMPLMDTAIREIFFWGAEFYVAITLTPVD